MKTQTHPQGDESSVIVKLGVSGQIAIPTRLRHQLRLRPGRYMRIQQDGPRLVLTPQQLVDWELEADLAQSFKDLREGRSYGPFDTAKEAIAFLHAAVKKHKRKSPKSS